MNSTKYLIGIFLTPVVPSLFYFSNHEASLSKNQVDWGAFGSYMGGIVGPVVAAITLLFLIDSYKNTSKQAALQTFLTYLEKHVSYAMTYKTQYSGCYTGHEYLDWLWKVIAGASQDNLIERINKNYGEIKPLVTNIQLLISVIAKDSAFNKEEKSHYIQHVYARLTSVELKLFLASSLIDIESKSILQTYDHTCGGHVISKPATEDWLIDEFVRQIKT
jgi:hypothetical protein